MLDRYKHAVENGWRKASSPFLLRQEMPAFVVSQTAGGKVKAEHESMKHDDRVFADAISFIISNDTDSDSKRVEQKFTPEPDRLPEIVTGYVPLLGVRYSQVAEGFEEQ
jgi:hypothetical protein